jgi:hypothetical protein
MNKRSGAASDAWNLCWKVAYLLFELDGKLYRQFAKLPDLEQQRIFQRCLRLSFDYAFWRQTDAFALFSPQFFARTADLIAGLGVPNGFQSEAIGVFPDGAASLAASVASCLLRYEGFQLRPGKNETDFLDEIRGACTKLRRIEYQGVVKRVTGIVKKYWVQTGEPHLEAFKEVHEFRQRQGGCLSSLLASQ